MRNLTRKKTLLEKEFQLLIQELKDSGLKVNENFEQENNRNVFEVTFVKKKEHLLTGTVKYLKVFLKKINLSVANKYIS